MTTETTSRTTSPIASPTLDRSTTLGSPCMDLNVQDCAGVPYTQTTTPNLIGHTTFEEALVNFERQYSGLLTIRCSSFVKEFVCSVYFPPCTAMYSMFHIFLLFGFIPYRWTKQIHRSEREGICCNVCKCMSRRWPFWFLVSWPPHTIYPCLRICYWLEANTF